VKTKVAKVFNKIGRDELPRVLENYGSWTRSIDVQFSDGKKWYAGYCDVYEDGAVVWKMLGPEEWPVLKVTHWCNQPVLPND
jgi:hypothetical protein